MMRTVSVGIMMFLLLEGCSQTKNPHSSGSTLNCILLGNDSVAFYYGSSDQMIDLTRGKITDTIFMDRVMQQAKKHAHDTAFQIKIKPTAGADVGNNFSSLVNGLNNNDIRNRSTDTLDLNEQLVFQASSLQEIMNAMTSKSEPVQLYLPKEDGSSNRNAIPLTNNTIVVLVYDKHGIYAYTGKNMKAGRVYTSEEFRKYLLQKKNGENTAVLIKSSAQSAYSNIVDMLDQMAITGIKKYSLIDITKEEETFLNGFNK